MLSRFSWKARKRSSTAASDGRPPSGSAHTTQQGHCEQALDRHRSMSYPQGEWAGGSLRASTGLRSKHDLPSGWMPVQTQTQAEVDDSTSVECSFAVIPCRPSLCSQQSPAHTDTRTEYTEAEASIQRQ
jgi:hypothetical protein